MNEDKSNEDEFDKEGLKINKPKQVKKPTSLSEKIKNRLRYRKNKWKLKLYNKKYREKNKSRLQRERKLKNRLKKAQEIIFEMHNS